MEAAIQKKISVLTFGAGAIGSYFGGSLALAGHKVVFIEQPVVVAELHKNGIQMDLSLDPRRKSSEPIHLSSSSYQCVSSLQEALKFGPFDVAIFALKSFDTRVVLESIQPFIEEMPPILCLQNGVDNESTLTEVLGPGRVIAGTTTHSIGRLGTGRIVLERLRGVGISKGPDASLNQLAELLVETMNEAFLNARLYEQADDMKWSKMLTNLMANATAAILDMTPAEVFNHPGLYQLEMGMMREALNVMDAQGIQAVDLPKVPVRLLVLAVRSLPDFIVKPLLTRMVGGGRGGKMPSFHIDLHSGRGKIEVDYLNGAVVRAGQKTGKPTPINQLLNETLLKLVSGELKVQDYSGKPEKLLANL